MQNHLSCARMLMRTKVSMHVETVCLLSKLREAKHHVSVKLDMDEKDLTSAESKATYEEIKKYVAEHSLNDPPKMVHRSTDSQSLSKAFVNALMVQSPTFCPFGFGL